MVRTAQATSPRAKLAGPSGPQGIVLRAPCRLGLSAPRGSLNFLGPGRSLRILVVLTVLVTFISNRPSLLGFLGIVLVALCPGVVLATLRRLAVLPRSLEGPRGLGIALATGCLQPVSSSRRSTWHGIVLATLCPRVGSGPPTRPQIKPQTYSGCLSGSGPSACGLNASAPRSCGLVPSPGLERLGAPSRRSGLNASARLAPRSWGPKAPWCLTWCRRFALPAGPRSSPGG